MDNTYNEMAIKLNYLLKTKASVKEVFTLIDKMDRYEKNKYDNIYQYPSLNKNTM